MPCVKYLVPMSLITEIISEVTLSSSALFLFGSWQYDEKKELYEGFKSP